MRPAPSRPHVCACQHGCMPCADQIRPGEIRQDQARSDEIRSDQIRSEQPRHVPVCAHVCGRAMSIPMRPAPSRPHVCACQHGCMPCADQIRPVEIRRDQIQSGQVRSGEIGSDHPGKARVSPEAHVTGVGVRPSVNRGLNDHYAEQYTKGIALC